MPTILELGQAVKKKYPGEYDNIPDGELGARIKLKYPEGYSEYTDAPPRRNEGMGKPLTPGKFYPEQQTQEEKTSPNQSAFRELVGKPAIETLPIVGSYFGPAGAGIGASLKQAAKSGMPSLFGESEGSGIGEAVSDVTLNSLIPSFITKGIGALLSPKKAFIDLITKRIPLTGGRSIASTSMPVKQAQALEEGSNKIGNALLQSQQADKLVTQAEEFGSKGAERFLKSESTILEKAARSTEGNVVDIQQIANKATTPKEFNQAFNEYTDKYGSNEVALSLLRLQKDVEKGASSAAQQAYSKISSNVMSDISQIRNMKLAVGESGEMVTSALARRNALSKGYNFESQTLDPDKVLSEIGGIKNQERYLEAMGKDGLKDFTEFLTQAKNIKEVASGMKSTAQETITAAEKEVLGIENTKSGLLQYAKRRFIFGLPFLASSLATGGTSLLAGTGLAGGLVLSDVVIGKLMADPVSRGVVLSAIKNPQLIAPSVVSKIIMNTLRGTAVTIQMPDDKDQKAIVGPEGQIQYQR